MRWRGLLIRLIRCGRLRRRVPRWRRSIWRRGLAGCGLDGQIVLCAPLLPKPFRQGRFVEEILCGYTGNKSRTARRNLRLRALPERGRQGRVRWIAWIRRIPARLLLLWGSAILHASTEPLWQPCIIRRPTVNALPRLLIGGPLLWKASAHWHTTWLGQRCAARRTDGGSLAVMLPTTRTRYHGRTPFRTNGPTVCSALYITAARSHAPGKALRIPTHAAGVVGQCTIRHYAAQMDYYFCGACVALSWRIPWHALAVAPSERRANTA